MVVEFRNKNKEKMTICDGVRDHIIPHLTGKDFSFKMWDSLCKIYQSPNQNKNMVLQDTMKRIRMLDSKLVTSFLHRFTQIRDELATAREIVDLGFMVRTTLNNWTTLNNFTKPWDPFV
jgi:hypothetical protein